MRQAYYGTVLMGLMFGCSAAGADPAPVFEIAEAPQVVPVQEVFDNTVLDEALRPALEVARDRWITAACIDIRLDGGGAQWSSTVDSIPMPDGRRANGSMDVTVDPPVGLLWLSSPLERTATHEMGHRLGIKHVEGKELMNERNLVNRQQGLRYDHIGEDALDQLCSKHDCGCYNPESGPSYDPSLIEVRQCQTITGGVSSWGPCQVISEPEAGSQN